MRKISKILKGLCLWIGVISLVGIAKPVYAANSSDINIQANTQVDQQFPQIPDAVDAGSHLSIPADGDMGELNVRWTNSLGRYYYCKDESRVKVIGWQQIEGSWYYFSSSNYEMQIGWLNYGGAWYYLNDYSDLKSDKVRIPTVKTGLGTMKTGWLQYNGNWYYLKSDGSMVTNTTIDGYVIGADGAYIG